jgi:lysophospholipase L1-like esterase
MQTTNRVQAAFLVFCLQIVALSCAAAEPGELVRQAKRIVFLGDSITFDGRYVGYVDAWLVSRRLDPAPTVIDMGLSSETVSGLSEEGHAGGQFPRPDLAERLDRVLATAKPDLVFACYGINCGIYKPLDAERFERYRQGMERLKKTVEQAGAKLIVVTPPTYDSVRAKKNEFYDGVLTAYSQWLVSRRADGWQVIDLHGPMAAELARRRQADAAFTFQPDAVHPNEEGHWLMARKIIAALGDEAAASASTPKAMLVAAKVPESVLPLVESRMRLLRDAYVGAAGHKRPGVGKGLPIAEAESKAAELTAKIRAAL